MNVMGSLFVYVCCVSVRYGLLVCMLSSCVCLLVGSDVLMMCLIFSL